MTLPALRPSNPASGPDFAASPCGALWVGVQGRALQLRPSGAVWLETERTLIAADLHLEKGSHFAARGQLLPPYDTAATLARLMDEALALKPQRLILLGDSFHDRMGPARMGDADRARLVALASAVRLTWIAGNHDAEGLDRLPGEVSGNLALGGLLLRHEPTPGPAPGELAGHLHPCAKVSAAGRAVRRRCFATDGQRLILPAFGAYAGGLNLRDPAYDGLFRAPPLAAALGAGRVRPLSFTTLLSD